MEQEGDLEQLTFDFLTTEQPEPEKSQVDVGDWCLIYLVTKSGGNQGNLFLLHREDAIKLCSDECSHGQARGGHWMFQWTSMSHFVSGDAAAKEHEDVHGNLPGFKFVHDTGKQDADFERLGIKKPTLKEMCELLRSWGYLFEFA